jgi:hypothetical protein
MAPSPLPMRLDHLEVTFPIGTLTQEFRDDVDAFFCGIFGWTSQSMRVFDGDCHRLTVDAGQFIMLAESEFPTAPPAAAIGSGPGETMFVPHLGITLDTVEDIDRVVEACRAYQEKDPRLHIKEFPLTTYFEPNAASKGVLVKYLLPIWFDLHARSWKPGTAPEKDYRYWCYAPRAAAEAG